MSRKSHLTSLALSGLLVIPTGIAFVTPAYAASGTNSAVAVLHTANKTKYTGTDANVRSGPGTKYKVVKTLKAGTKVVVTSSQSGWSKISSPKVGWIRSDLLSDTSTTSSELFIENSVGKRMDSGCFLAGTTFKTTDDLNLRAKPTTASEIVLTVPKAEEITLNTDSCFGKDSWVSNDWYGVRGWLFTHYLVAIN